MIYNPHYFKGRIDRGCEDCGYPDRAPHHIRNFQNMPHCSERLDGERWIEQQEKKLNMIETSSKYLGDMDRVTIDFTVGPTSVNAPKRITVLVDRTGIRFDLTNCSLEPSFWLLNSDLQAIAKIAQVIRMGTENETES